MEITSNGKTITLNSSQIEFLERYKIWRKDKDKLFFCLSGSAGTGKTTCIKEAIKDEYSICVSAPTHKAKKVISKMTGRHSETIQRILGLKPGLDLKEFSNKNLLFALKGNNLMPDYNLIVIDEASMINAELVLLIKKVAKENGTKVIFMGDVKQLPPVKEKISLVFVDDEIEHFNLTKVERQQVGNPLILLLDDIIDGKSPEKTSNFTKDELGFKWINSPQEFTDELMKKFEFGVYSDNKILCWTNQKASQWNNLIRRKMLGDKINFLIPGEFLMAQRSVNDLVNWRINITENSCEYKVVSLKEDKREQRYYNKTTGKDDYVNILGYDVTLLNLDTNETKYVFIVARESYEDFMRIDVDKHEYAMKQPEGQAKGYAFKMYYDFRNRYFLLEDIGGVCEADFKYSYALTTHKSQGSTYQNVFVDYSDLEQFFDKKMTKEENEKMKTSLKYVALSRASNAAYIYWK